MNKKDIKTRILEIVRGNPPAKDKYLFSTLSTEYIHLFKPDIYKAVDELILEGKLIQFSYRADGVRGSLYFPVGSSFVFGSYHDTKESK
jgi:hypothetical protein